MDIFEDAWHSGTGTIHNYYTLRIAKMFLKELWRDDICGAQGDRVYKVVEYVLVIHRDRHDVPLGLAFSAIKSF
ncbi:hypothetical protein CSA56_07720 [candidate division KSB3 bacterium]|uniref:Uncharacterized protein n=1 Tax=candidate division KSB3 bacterium TaxID=2044937 RepID=A0A2G6KF23_9BACT|nr:MAG: hypothetical protein CSA56_07720 [candidate division KSB3 bacterium]